MNLQHLVNELNTNYPMNAVELFLSIMTYKLEEMTDEEIVGSVQSMSKDTESDGEEETFLLESLDNVFNFLVHPPASRCKYCINGTLSYENKC